MRQILQDFSFPSSFLTENPLKLLALPQDSSKSRDASRHPVVAVVHPYIQRGQLHHQSCSDSLHLQRRCLLGRRWWLS